MVSPFHILLEIELLHRLGGGSIGQPGQEAGHGQPDIAGILGFPQGTPGGIFRGLKDLGQIPGIGQFLPGFHLHR